MTDRLGDYEVGYGKPPKQTRFRKGRSGNPKGRPAGSPNVATVLARTLNERVVIKENGRRERVTKLVAVIKQLANKAMGGDVRAARELLVMVRDGEGTTAASIPSAPAFAPQEADRAVMREIADRVRRLGRQENDNARDE